MAHGIFEKQKYSKTNITEFRFETIITLIEVSRNLKVKSIYTSLSKAFDFWNTLQKHMLPQRTVHRELMLKGLSCQTLSILLRIQH